MDKETWVKKVTKELGRCLGAGYELEPVNSEQETVIKIQKEGDITGISLNLSVCEPAWLYHEEKVSKAAAALEKEYRRRYEALRGDAISGKDFEQVKHMVVYVLEKRNGNEEALSHIPYEEFYDLILIFELHLHRQSESYRRVINNEDLKQWGVDKQKLLEAARQNTPVLYPPVIGLLESGDKQEEETELEPIEISELSSLMMDKDSAKLFILTSINGQFGAGCIFYDDLLKQIAGICQDNLVLFYTSPYEILLFPSRGGCWHMKEWMELVSEMEWARGFGDWSFLDSFYLYDMTEETINLLKEGRNLAKGLAS